MDSRRVFLFDAAIIVRNHIIRPKFFRQDSEQKKAMLSGLFDALVELGVESNQLPHREVVVSYDNTISFVKTLKRFAANLSWGSAESIAHTIYFLATPSAYISARQRGTISESTLLPPFSAACARTRFDVNKLNAIFNYEFYSYVEHRIAEKVEENEGNAGAICDALDELINAVSGNTTLSVLYNATLSNPTMASFFGLAVYDEDIDPECDHCWDENQIAAHYDTLVFCNVDDEQDMHDPNPLEQLTDELLEEIADENDLGDIQHVGSASTYEQQNINDPDA